MLVEHGEPLRFLCETLREPNARVVSRKSCI